jgi:hypothetical protein
VRVVYWTELYVRVMFGPVWISVTVTDACVTVVSVTSYVTV